jgi:hypothetical protein
MSLGLQVSLFVFTHLFSIVWLPRLDRRLLLLTDLLGSHQTAGKEKEKEKEREEKRREQDFCGG